MTVLEEEEDRKLLKKNMNMITVFETREISFSRSFGFTKEEIQRISDWRNGIAIARIRVYVRSYEQTWNYYLINHDFDFVYSKIWYDEDKIEGEQIERVFGGYYVVRNVRAKCIRTFPGKDEENQYIYTTYIQDVIDEYGNVLEKDERNAYLETHPVTHTTEYGDGIVQCGTSFYGLDNYQYLFEIPKEVEPLGFFRDGKCKVKVITDYRDFIVLVKDKRITRVFNAEDFIFISKLLGIDLETWGRESLKSSHKPFYRSVKKPKDITSCKEIKPETEIRIHNYEIGVSSYSIDCGGELYYDENYGFYRTQLIPGTSYYFVENEWRKIDAADAEPIFEKIFEQDCNRPNFIKDIRIIATDILLDEEEYSIYKFECRPYGYITKDGYFDYNFDINNIKW